MRKKEKLSCIASLDSHQPQKPICNKPILKHKLSCTASTISYIKDNHDQVVDYFLNALRFCYIEESIVLEGIVIDRVNALQSDYWFNG
ncbi:hypothetical protein AAVH_18401, partial [Aphelenchoides avenae]